MAQGASNPELQSVNPQHKLSDAKSISFSPDHECHDIPMLDVHRQTYQDKQTTDPFLDVFPLRNNQDDQLGELKVEMEHPSLSVSINDLLP